MGNTGWVKLHRKIQSWEWYSDGNTFRLFIHLLLCANHKSKKWRGVLVGRGQLVTGRQSLSARLNLSERAIRTAFSHLRATGEIAVKTTNKYSIVTILNFDTYQTPEMETDQQPTINKEC